jgi:hypothetical protein
MAVFSLSRTFLVTQKKMRKKSHFIDALEMVFFLDPYSSTVVAFYAAQLMFNWLIYIYVLYAMFLFCFLKSCSVPLMGLKPSIPSLGGRCIGPRKRNWMLSSCHLILTRPRSLFSGRFNTLVCATVFTC